MKFIDCIQYSPEWWEAKRGVPSSSNARKIVTPETGKLSGSSVKYACELIAQLITPGDYWLESVDKQSTAMAHGSILEGEARRFLAMERGVDITEVGFITNDAGTAGASPDGMYAGNERGLEIKCPMLKTQIGYLIDNVLPSEYKPQVHFSMAVTGCRSWDFISYCRLTDPLMVTVEWDSYTDAVSAAIDSFAEMYLGMQQRINDKITRFHQESYF